MSTPTISAVIPAFNAERTIRRAIDSILVQQRPADEIIVVDDGSKRPLEPLLKSYGSAIHVARRPNGHAAAARNHGIDLARGEWIAFLDADDYWEPDKLQRQAEIAERYPQLGLIAGRSFCHLPGEIRNFHRSGRRRCYDRVLQLKGPAAFQLGTLVWTGMAMVRRSVLQQDRFVPGLEPAEDRDLWIRLAAKYPVYLTSQPLATAVLEPGGISRRDIRHECTQMLRVIERHRQLLGVPARLVWQSYVRYRWSKIESSPRAAVGMLLRSFARWPAPYVGLPGMPPLGRLRRLATLLRMSWRSQSTPHGRSVA